MFSHLFYTHNLQCHNFRIQLCSAQIYVQSQSLNTITKISNANHQMLNLTVTIDPELNLKFESLILIVTISIQQNHHPQSESERKYLYNQSKYTMGGQTSGALNTAGFSHQIQSKQLPDFNHITHCGIFNQNYFSVGDRAESLLEIHHGLGISNCDLYDIAARNYFLSLFMKSSTDGQKRTRPLNVVVSLDVSGSMDGALSYKVGEEYPPSQQKSRIALAKKAILMLFDKLQDDDVFGLTTFHTSAKTIIKNTLVKNIDRNSLTQIVNQRFESGGTTISTGFHESLKNIEQFRKQNTLSQNYQNRIVLLTDVGDNSVAGQLQLIQSISNAGVSTTIIGVSDDFKSHTCQQLIKIKGFNYFCAVENDDLQTYLVDQFDYTFFPCVKNVIISVESQMIQSLKVYGSVDYDVVYQKIGNTHIVTKMKTGFPSALSFDKQGKIETKGGLILVNLIMKQSLVLPKITLKINLSYEDMNGKSFSQSYEVDKTIESEQYYSDQALKKGVSLFYYTQTIRNLLKDMKQGSNVLSDGNKGFYLAKLDKLKEHCPRDKLQQLSQLYTIVQEK